MVRPQRPLSLLARILLGALVLALAACGLSSTPPGDAHRADRREASPHAARVAEGESAGPLTLTAADPSWGDAEAPVTIVQFSDFECPFCKKVASTIAQLQREHGPERLRVVWKNDPLGFHANARPAAEAAMAIYAKGGAAAFFRFHDAIFGAEGRLSPEIIDRAVAQAGFTRGELDQLIASTGARDKVDADIALASALGVQGTPAFFINGVSLGGAQPLEAFRAVIDEELRAAKELVAAGTPPGRVYAERTRKNLEQPLPGDGDEAAEGEPSPDVVHRVPVGTSPVRGDPKAPVTIVVFSDFQCPFCAHAAPVLAQVLAAYKAEVRLVWKNAPLPFHMRAEPAAELALEARAQGGDAAFWKVHDLLFAANQKLEDSDLAAIATAAGLDAAKAMRAVAAHAHAGAIDEDMDVGDDVEANGTPTFFINGRVLVGAQPFEAFKQRIDAELARTAALVASGTPPEKIYDAIQKTAVGPAPPAKVTVPAPTAANPTKGPASAKIIVHVFGDFQCPFCKRAEPTLGELDRAFPGQIRFVWHNLPLASIHPFAMQAAEASMEAFHQKGATGFWRMHDALYEDQGASGLDRAALSRHAKDLGLNVAAFDAALDGGAHRAAIEADTRLADAAGIDGTPAFVIDGVVISGAQPIAKFKAAVRRALPGK